MEYSDIKPGMTLRATADRKIGCWRKGDTFVVFEHRSGMAVNCRLASETDPHILDGRAQDLEVVK